MAVSTRKTAQSPCTSCIACAQRNSCTISCASMEIQDDSDTQMSNKPNARHSLLVLRLRGAGDAASMQGELAGQGSNKRMRKRKRVRRPKFLREPKNQPGQRKFLPPSVSISMVVASLEAPNRCISILQRSKSRISFELGHFPSLAMSFLHTALLFSESERVIVHELWHFVVLLQSSSSMFVLQSRAIIMHTCKTNACKNLICDATYTMHTWATEKVMLRCQHSNHMLKQAKCGTKSLCHVPEV
jgi:hypothetical protein